MEYSIHALAKLAGVSVRTLHYYDRIGLLKPAGVKPNGYRVYSRAEVDLLQQILFFRELEIPLNQIKRILFSPGYDRIAVLTDQEKLLVLKQQRLRRLIKTIKETINFSKGGSIMSDDKKYSAFNDPDYLKYKDEAQKRWGNTEAYQQSRERVGKMTKAEMAKVKAEGEQIADTVAGLLKKGFGPESPEVQKQINLFYLHLKNFYDPSPEMFRGLGRMYVDDPRFTAYYEKRATGLAVFMKEAMGYFAGRMKK